jgi:hypothetical protein
MFAAATASALARATRRPAARLDTCGPLTGDEVRAGDPAEVLIDVTGQQGADLIVVGPRGRRGWPTACLAAWLVSGPARANGRLLYRLLLGFVDYVRVQGRHRR